MKFGAELHAKIYEPWRHAYIQYNELKQTLKQRQMDHGWRERDELDFVGMFEKELDKVHRFVQLRLDALEPRVAGCEEKLKLLSASYDTVADTLADTVLLVNDLARFVYLNVTGFEKMVKKHDKWTHLDLATKYRTLLKKYPLDKQSQHIDVLIVRISHAHDLCTLHGATRTKKKVVEEECDEEAAAFERATAKYWVHPDNITEVKAIILFHLPVHVYNKKKAYEAEDAAISSVYFDNADFDLYSNRLERTEGAEAIRFRWYGQETRHVYIERKTHHAPWKNGHSVKDRFRLKEHLVDAYMHGQYTADNLIADSKLNNKQVDHQQHFVAQGIQNSIATKRLHPMCRVYYNRTAFQVPGDQRLRISLDCNMTFVREDGMDGKSRAGTHWRRTDVGIDYPFHGIDEADIHRFPYAVLETKIQTHLGQQTPPWLQTLLDSHLVHEVPRFSKYLHGASQLYRNQVPVLPYWLEQLSMDIRKQPSVGVGLSRSLSFQPLINGHHRHSLLGPSHLAIDLPTQGAHTKTKEQPSNRGDTFARLLNYPRFLDERAKKKKHDDPATAVLPTSRRPAQRVVPMKKTEPKTFFANERTFISWLQFCALLLTVALNLLNNGDHISRIIGAVFIIMSSILCL